MTTRKTVALCSLGMAASVLIGAGSIYQSITIPTKKEVYTSQTNIEVAEQLADEYSQKRNASIGLGLLSLVGFTLSGLGGIVGQEDLNRENYLKSKILNIK